MHKKRGFTLVELAIVLTVIGLIIGAVIGGMGIIHNSHLQTAIADAERYKKAVMLFKEKYNELPGDFSNATSIWGTDPGGCPNTPANVARKITTCNGNGDGFIGDSTGSVLGGAGRWYESYRVWQHLANAGLIEGGYTGALSSRTTGNNVDPDMNIPANAITGSAYTLLNAAPGSASGVFAANYNHVLVLGAPSGPYASTYKPVLTPEEALLLDQKIDDGKPGMGNILSFTPALSDTPNCATSAVESSAAYNIASPGIQCSLIFITGF